jgi:DNA-binding transcriptional regulator/RsmH inhibitor MraZ
MRSTFLAGLAVASLLMAAPSAGAVTVNTAAGIQQSLAETSVVEQVRRVCQRNIFTGKVRCWVDRSRRPTVCHRIRGTNRFDCY